LAGKIIMTSMWVHALILAFWYYQKWREHFPVHKTGRIDDGKVFQNLGNVFWIGGNKFYDRKNEILIEIPEGKMSGIRIIAEFCRIPTGFPNQVLECIHAVFKNMLQLKLIWPIQWNPVALMSFYQTQHGPFALPTIQYSKPHQVQQALDKTCSSTFRS
jgi:hypothetical protein